jgi:hypothetical protein
MCHVLGRCDFTESSPERSEAREALEVIASAIKQCLKRTTSSVLKTLYRDFHAGLGIFKILFHIRTQNSDRNCLVKKSKTIYRASDLTVRRVDS